MILTTINPTMQLQKDTTLQGGRYRIIEVLGRGGFGITYLAEQVMAKRKVCIKEFFPKDYYKRNDDSCTISLLSDSFTESMERFKEKFIKEAQTIAALDHANIIPIHDVFEDNNTAYYVMDFIEGESMTALVKRCGALTEEVAVSYIRQVASALEYIHAQHIMHLDVKPSNIMLRHKDDRGILIDFGLAKHYDEKSDEATSTTPVGVSHGYAPMEQYRLGGVSSFSPETDIYSLGATLYFLVTGQTPPQAADVADEGLPELPAHLSSATRHAIVEAMAEKRRQRPHSIKAFLDLLDATDNDTTATAAAIAPQKIEDADTTADEATVVTPTHEKEAEPTVEYPKLKSEGMETRINIISAIMLIGATLHLFVSYVNTSIIGATIQNMLLYNEEALRDISLAPWMLLVQSVIATTLIAAIIRRRGDMIITFTTCALVAGIIIRGEIIDYIDLNELPAQTSKGVKFLQGISIFGIVLTGMGAACDKILSLGTKRKSTDDTYAILSAGLFMLTLGIPLLYPEWEIKDRAVLDKIDESKFYTEDNVCMNIAYYASIAGIAASACRRHRLSLMAALFIMVAMPVALISERGLKVHERHFDWLGVTTSDLAVSTPIILTVMIAAIIVILMLTAMSKDKEERWSNVLPLLPSLALMCIGYCTHVLKRQSIDVVHYSSIFDFDHDVTLYLRVAAIATPIFIVCRQHRAAIVTSALSAILSFVVIQLAHGIESKPIAYGSVMMAALTLCLAAYSSYKDRRDTRWDVIVAVISLTIIFCFFNDITGILTSLSDKIIIYHITALMLLAITALVLINCMRRNTIATIFMLGILLITLYIIGDKVTDTADFKSALESFEPKYRSRYEGTLLLKNCAVITLIISVLYTPLKRLIKIINKE